MNNIALWIYLMGVVDKADFPVFLVAALSGAILVLSGFFLAVDPPGTSNEERARFVHTCKVSGILFLISTSISVLMPNSKTLAAMIVVPAIVENQRIQNLGDNSLKLIEEKMKAWLDEQVKK